MAVILENVTVYIPENLVMLVSIGQCVCSYIIIFNVWSLLLGLLFVLKLSFFFF